MILLLLLFVDVIEWVCQRFFLSITPKSELKRENEKCLEKKKRSIARKKSRSQEKHIYEVQMILKSVCDSFLFSYLFCGFLYLFFNFLETEIIGAGTRHHTNS